MNSTEWRNEAERLADEYAQAAVNVIAFGADLIGKEESARAALLEHLDATPAAQPIEPTLEALREMADDGAVLIKSWAVQGDITSYRVIAIGRDRWRQTADAKSLEDAIVAASAADAFAPAAAPIEQPTPQPAMDALPSLDEREAFEAKFPMPPNCTWTGRGYCATEYNAWAAHDHCRRWEGWQARALLAVPQQPKQPEGHQATDSVVCGAKTALPSTAAGVPVVVAANPSLDQGPCTVCGKLWRDHGTYPVYESHNYTPASGAKTPDGGKQ